MSLKQAAVEYKGSYPVNRKRRNNVVSTSPQHHGVAATLKRRCNQVVYLVTNKIQQAQNIEIN